MWLALVGLEDDHGIGALDPEPTGKGRSFLKEESRRESCRAGGRLSQKVAEPCKKCLGLDSLLAHVIDDLGDVIEENLRDFAFAIADFDGWFAEGLCAAQVVYLAAKASSIPGLDLDISTVEHPLEFFHHAEEISHLSSSLIGQAQRPDRTRSKERAWHPAGWEVRPVT